MNLNSPTAPDPWRNPECECADAAAALHAELAGTQLELCPVHQQREIRDRERDAARSAHAERAALAEHARRSLDRTLDGTAENAQPTCQCNGLNHLTAALTGHEVAPCPIHRPALTDSPLGSDALVDAVARAVGAPTSDHNDSPPAAA